VPSEKFPFLLLGHPPRAQTASDIGSAVFVWLTHVTNTVRQHHSKTSVAVAASSSAAQAVWPVKKVKYS